MSSVRLNDLSVEELAGHLAYRRPGQPQWLPISEDSYRLFNSTTEVDEAAREKVKSNRATVDELLAASLQYTHLGFFSGSGTSLGDAGGPSMRDLWEKTMCEVTSAPDLTNDAKYACDLVRYKERKHPNIEHFLSHCDAFLSFNEDIKLQTFVLTVKEQILDLCSEFLLKTNSDISAHHHLLQKLARRRVRDPRLKIFTTNYDTCFETAASELGMMVVDGFSYTRRRRFDGRHFTYDIVRRDGELHEFVEGIFLLYKLHGSVSWERHGNDVFEASAPSAEKACLIYPTRGKYQQAFIQPHLELLSRFLDFLRRPNTCLVISGFGFNDDHLSEPILSAIQSNPSLRLIITDYCCISHIEHSETSSSYWSKLSTLAEKGLDIHFIGSSFSNFVDLIPSMRAVTPAEQLANAIKRIGTTQ